MSRKQKLELTWVGKDERPRLVPRILIEEPSLSYHAATPRDGDIFDNMLIQGDNLLALKALEQDSAGKIKCVFIDPPYNTGSAFEHYDDGVEHSLWLSLMRGRLEIIQRLLSKDGSLWITIDDNEAHYLKVLCDEIFGRLDLRGRKTKVGEAMLTFRCPTTTYSYMPRSAEVFGQSRETYFPEQRHSLDGSEIPITTSVVPGGKVTTELPRAELKSSAYR